MDNADGAAVCNEANFNGGTSILVGTIRNASTFRLAQGGGKDVEFQVADGGMLYSGGILGIGCGKNATLTVNGGAVYSAGDLRVGNNASSTATLTINSGSVEVASGKSLILSSGGTGTVNLKGGTLKTRLIKKGNGRGILNFDGGTLQANAENNSNFIDSTLSDVVNVKSGGGTIDTDGNNIKIGKSFTGEGAMRFKGGGTITFEYGTIYEGGTTIELGTKVNVSNLSSTKMLDNLVVDGRAVLENKSYDVLVASGLSAADLSKITLTNCAAGSTVTLDNAESPTKIVVNLAVPVGVNTSTPILVFPGKTLNDIKYADLTSRMFGRYAKDYNALDTAKGYNKKFYYDDGNLLSIVVEFQVSDGANIRCVVVEFTNNEDGVCAKALGARYQAGVSLGYVFLEQNKTTWHGAFKAVAASYNSNDYGVCDFRYTLGEHRVIEWILDADKAWSVLRNGAALAGDELVQITVTDADAVLTVDEDVAVRQIVVMNGANATLKINENVELSADNYTGLGYVLNNGTFQKRGDGTVDMKFDVASRGVFVVNAGTLKATGKRASGGGTPIIGDPDVTPRSNFLIDVKRGATYDVNGQTSVSASVRLAEGARFISSSDANTEWGQTIQLILAGDANVAAAGTFGVYGATSNRLDLGSHTLTVAPASGKQFFLGRATIAGDGIISVENGTLAVRNMYDVIGADCTLSIGSGGTLFIAPGAYKLSVKNFVNGGSIDSNTIGTLEVTGTLTPGEAVIPKLRLIDGATVKAMEMPQVVSTTFTATGEYSVDASKIEKEDLKDRIRIPVLTVPVANRGGKWNVSNPQIPGTTAKWVDDGNGQSTLYLCKPTGLMLIIH